MNAGHVVQVIGVVVTFVFRPDRCLTYITSLKIKSEKEDIFDGRLTLPWKLPSTWVTTRSRGNYELHGRPGPRHGSSGTPGSLPISTQLAGPPWGASVDVLGGSIDGKGPTSDIITLIHRPALPWWDQSTKTEQLETGIKVIDFPGAFRQGW